MSASWRSMLVATSLIGLSAGCVGNVEDEAAMSDEDLPLGEARQAEIISCPADLAPQLSNVVYGKELVITNPAVVDDPCRTVFSPTDPSCTNASVNGRWSFWYLMTKIAGTNNVSRFVSRWLESFEDTPIVNGQALQARTLIRSKVIDPWRQKSGCAVGMKYDAPGGACNLSPAFAPFRLLAIVNRADLRAGGAGSVDAYGNISNGGDAGEGRFIFGFVDLNDLDIGNPKPLQASAILEYKIPTSGRTARQWALDWRALGSFADFGPSYRSALQTITDRFTNGGVASGNPNNGSAIRQVRTDDFPFDPNSSKVWSLREFRLGCLPGQVCGTNDKFLVNSVTAQTPRDSMNATALLQSFISQNKASIENGSHAVPATFNGSVFLGGDSTSKQFGSAFQWKLQSPDASLDTARRLFAFSTCNGCHYLETDNTGNMHVKNRKAGVEAQLSAFMTQPITVFNDPSGSTPEYDEPLRRKCELLALAAGRSTPVSSVAGRPH